MAATTTLLGLLTPTQGTLSGTWGDSVNYGISDYVDIAVAGTLSFAGDGAITLANTTGSASGNGFTSTTAQYMVIRVTGTLTTTKSITGPSYSKLYLVDNAATGGAVSFLRSGQATPVTIAAGESAFVYYNGTDYIKVTSDLILGGYTTTATAAGTTTLTAASTQTQFFTGTTTQTVVLPVVATLVLGTVFTIHNNSTGDLTVNSSGGNLVATIAPNTTFTLTCILTSGTTAASWDADFTGFTSVLPVVRGGTGVATSTGSGDVVLSTSPTLVTPALGTVASGNVGACTVDGTNKVGYFNIPRSGAAKTTSYTLAVGDVGEFIQLDTGGSVVVPDATFALGDAVVIYNNTAGSVTLTMSIGTAYIAGTAVDKATISLAPVGIANILFISGSICVVTGNVT